MTRLQAANKSSSGADCGRQVIGRRRHGLLLLALFLGCAAARGGEGGDPPELTVFLSADGVAVDGLRTAPAGADDWRAGADLLATWNPGPVRMLAEAVASSEEVELERLQLGWELRPNTILWIGRFHQPASYWGYLYHHGQFAQTAITKPQLDNWEDSGGLLPQHLEGMLLDASVTTSAGKRVDVSLGAGVSPRLVHGALEPLEILRHREGPRMPAYSARLTWFPDALLERNLGLLLSHAEIADLTTSGPSTAASGHFDQFAAGAFLDWPAGGNRWTAVAYHVDVRRSGTGGPGPHSFWSGYVFGEHELRGDLRLFGRLEATSSPAAPEYLRALQPVARSRAMLGLRWDLSRKQALTGEIAHSVLPQGTANEIRLQWSAVYP